MAGGGLLLAAALGLYWKGRIEGAAGERPKVDAAMAQAAIAGLEAQGERESAQRSEVVLRLREAAAETAIRLNRDAMTSEDAHAPLPADRTLRLHAHDDELCRLAPELAGCAPASDAARGDHALRPASSAEGAEPG
mgnify:FL=1